MFSKITNATIIIQQYKKVGVIFIRPYNWWKRKTCLYHPKIIVLEEIFLTATDSQDIFGKVLIAKIYPYEMTQI